MDKCSCSVAAKPRPQRLGSCNNSSNRQCGMENMICRKAHTMTCNTRYNSSMVSCLLEARCAVPYVHKHKADRC